MESAHSGDRSGIVNGFLPTNSFFTALFRQVGPDLASEPRCVPQNQ
jgi:hypothetical protein